MFGGGFYCVCLFLSARGSCGGRASFSKKRLLPSQDGTSWQGRLVLFGGENFQPVAMAAGPNQRFSWWFPAPPRGVYAGGF